MNDNIDIWEDWCEDCGNTETHCIHDNEKQYGGAE